jgi:enamine deaminase RidA (YjgF/YER057c/UK114 family)
MDCTPEPPGSARPSLLRQVGEGSHLVRLPSFGGTETFLGLSALTSESATSLFQRLYQFAAEHPELRIVRQDVFGVVPDASAHVPKAYRLNGAEWPVTWVSEGNGGGNPVAGIQIHAVDARRVRLVRWGGRVVGARFQDECAEYCVLAGLQPADARATRAVQTREVLELMEQVLAEAGLAFRDVIRTWFYLDDILDWYGEFNQVRNGFFQERGVYTGVMPASTGVGGGSASRTAVVADLLAVRAGQSGVSCVAVPSPLQSAAAEYGSSFSRAVELKVPGQRRLYVSGTASILPDGRTAHAGDVVAQVALTMEVVEAILKSRAMTWADAVRGIAYFKHMEDAPALDAWLHAHAVTDCPLIVAKNDICRDDLLFELELDAVALGPQ